VRRGFSVGSGERECWDGLVGMANSLSGRGRLTRCSALRSPGPIIGSFDMSLVLPSGTRIAGGETRKVARITAT
jgi:hypothetical protein